MGESTDKVDKFYSQFQTLPGLIGDLALNIAAAQRRLDQNYLESLAEFAKVVNTVVTDKGDAKQFLELFKAIAPSRYQFTETAIEVRADIQVASASETKVGVDVGIKTPVFTAAVNFSYLKRSASDHQAAALLRTVLNAIPADPGLLDKLLERAGETPKVEPQGADFKALAEAFKELTPANP